MTSVKDEHMTSIGICKVLEIGIQKKNINKGYAEDIEHVIEKD